MKTFVFLWSLLLFVGAFSMFFAPDWWLNVVKDIDPAKLPIYAYGMGLGAFANMAFKGFLDLKRRS